MQGARIVFIGAQGGKSHPDATIASGFAFQQGDADDPGVWVRLDPMLTQGEVVVMEGKRRRGGRWEVVPEAAAAAPLAGGGGN